MSRGPEEVNKLTESTYKWSSVKLASSQQRLLVLIQLEREAKVLKTIQKVILPSSVVFTQRHLCQFSLPWAEGQAKICVYPAKLKTVAVLLEIHLLRKGLQETGGRGMVLAGRAYYDGIAKIGDIAVASPVSKEL
ncbi:putative Brain-specific angiogenesis inhibitor 1-associated protein, partial [Naja naja]